MPAPRGWLTGRSAGPAAPTVVLAGPHPGPARPSRPARPSPALNRRRIPRGPPLFGLRWAGGSSSAACPVGSTACGSIAGVLVAGPRAAGDLVPRPRCGTGSPSSLAESSNPPRAVRPASPAPRPAAAGRAGSGSPGPPPNRAGCWRGRAPCGPAPPATGRLLQRWDDGGGRFRAAAEGPAARHSSGGQSPFTGASACRACQRGRRYSDGRRRPRLKKPTRSWALGW
jgi:hypothetical protein